MGLKRRISLYLISILSVLALLTLVALRWDSHQKAIQLEEVEARGDLRRLISTFQARELELSGTLKSWSNWTGLFDYFANRTDKFRDAELSVQAIAVASVDFLALLDLSGQLLDVTEVPGPNGETPATEVIQQDAHHYPAYLRLSEAASGCGAIQAQARVALVCLSPILDSEGGGQSRGYILLGRWVDAQMVRQISEVADLQFKISTVPTPAMGAQRSAAGEQPFSPEAVQILTHDNHLELRYPLAGLSGHTIAEIQMTWPRQQALVADRSYAATQALVIALIVTCGFLLVLLLDLVVVKRLNQLRRELRLIVDSKCWTGDVTVSGQDEIAALAGYTRSLVAVVHDQVQELQKLSQTDTLTGLPNRRAFNERLDHLLAAHARQQLPSALILMDVDHFKKYNDTYGHPAGDEVLQKVAHCLRTTLRRELDMPARMGGEEFGVLLPGANADQALATAEVIRTTLQDMAITHPANPPLGVITMSLGVAEVTAADTATSLYRRADEALYQAKNSGRNRVVLGD